MYESIKTFIKNLQDKGVVLLFVVDPVNKQPSVSLTLLIVSFTLWILSLSKELSNHLGLIDTDNALNGVIVTAGLYLGRSFSNKKVNMSSLEKEKEEN
jgi:hypothetical protein